MMNMAVPTNKMSTYLMSASDQELDNLAQTAGTPDIVSAVDQEMQRRRRAAQPLPRGGQPMGGNPPPSLQDIATGNWTPPWQQMSGPALPPGTSGPDIRPDGGRSGDPMGPADMQTDGGRFGNPMGSADVQPDGGRSGDPMQRNIPKNGEPMDDQRPMMPPTMPLTAPNSMEAGPSPIDQGVASADKATGDAGPDGIHPALAQAAQALQDDTPPSQLQGIIDKILGGGQSDDSIRSNAIAKAGFAMASSKNPYFFGALGEGGTAGLEDYEKSKQEQLMNQVRGVGLGQQQEQQGETKRSNKVKEGQEGQRIDVLRDQAQLARDDFIEKKRQFDAGFATEQELKKAQVAAQKASAAYSQAAAASVGRRGGQYFTADDGNTYYTEGAEARPVLDQNGKPIKGTSKVGANGGTAAQRNSKYYGDLLFGGDEKQGALFLAQGKTMAPDRRRAVAGQAATAELNADLSVLPGTAEYATKLQQRTKEIEDQLAQAGAGVINPGGGGTGGGATTQAQVDEFKKNGKKGDKIVVNGQTFTHP